MIWNYIRDFDEFSLKLNLNTNNRIRKSSKVVYEPIFPRMFQFIFNLFIIYYVLLY